MSKRNSNTDHSRRTFLKVHEIAERMGISSKKVRNSIYRGELEAVKIGRCLRVSKAEYWRWLKRSRFNPERKR